MTEKKQPEALRSLYEITHNIADLNTVLIGKGALNALNAENETLRTGYDAARLEIESLQNKLKAVDALGPSCVRALNTMVEHAGEYPVLPSHGHASDGASGAVGYSAEQMRAYGEACWKAGYKHGAWADAQPAGAQQPGAAYAALPDADSDYMRKVVAVAVTMLFDGYKEDVTRVFSTGELSEFVTITAAMGGERVEDIYRRAWDLLSLPVRASHGQAPAQAAPAAVAGPSEILEKINTLIASINEAHHSKDPGWRQGCFDAADNTYEQIKDMLAAAPTTQPAPPAGALAVARTTPAHIEAMERAWLWMENQADSQSKGGHATFNLMRLREERDALRAAIDAAPTTQPAPQQETQSALFDKQGFRAWVLHNLPDDTIIGSSAYWADHLSAWAQRFVKKAPQQEPGKDVHQFRKQHCADWYDGRADHSDGGGPYEERTLYTSPQQEAQEPVAWYVTGCGRLLDEYEAEDEARRIGGTAKAMPLYTAPQPASQGDALPTIKGASITGGYVVVTPAGREDDKATVLRDAILRTFPVNPAFTPKHDDAARAAQEGDK